MIQLIKDNMIKFYWKYVGVFTTIIIIIVFPFFPGQIWYLFNSPLQIWRLKDPRQN